MAAVRGPEPQVDGAIQERQQLEEVRDVLKALDIVQNAFASLTSSRERGEAEGRRCILAITGLRHHPRYAIYFEVTGSRIKQVEPFSNYTTLIEAPLDSILRVLKSLLDGKQNVFSEEARRGKAKFVGKRSIHDEYQFNQIANRLARLILAYKPKAIEGQEQMESLWNSVP